MHHMLITSEYRIVRIKTKQVNTNNFIIIFMNETTFINC